MVDSVDLWGGLLLFDVVYGCVVCHGCGWWVLVGICGVCYSLWFDVVGASWGCGLSLVGCWLLIGSCGFVNSVVMVPVFVYMATACGWV